MPPAFLVNYSPEDANYKVNVDRWLSLVFLPEKKISKTSIFMFVCTTVLYEYMTSFRNDVNNLFDITHVRIKIYGELYHCIIYITFEERHVRVTFNF